MQSKTTSSFVYKAAVPESSHLCGVGLLVFKMTRTLAVMQTTLTHSASKQGGMSRYADFYGLGTIKIRTLHYLSDGES